MFKKISVLTVLVFITFTSCAPTEKFLMRQRNKNINNNSHVRVLLLQTDRKINISSSSRLKIIDKSNGTILHESKNSQMTFYPQQIKGPIIIESPGEALHLENTPYRGVLELQNVMGKIYVINILNIDEYLYSVVPSEIPALWDQEALKAQAIAARTYAYYHIFNNKDKGNNKYDLDATTRFQLYQGIPSEKPSTSKAVDSTSGIILTFYHQPIISYFHSTCGGKTIDDRFVWPGKDMQYLRGIHCPYCKESPDYHWKEMITLDEINNYLRDKNKKIGRIKRISFQKKSGRVIGVIIYHSNGALKLSGNEFRLYFPEKKLKSMYFKSQKTKNGLIFLGKGWGHGVGLCQWGANGLAKNGANYKKILKYYYKGIKFDKIKYINKRYIANKNKFDNDAN